MSQNCVLVVDDDTDIRETLAEILTDEGYGVKTAANGQEALDFLRTADPRPCIVLCDLMMPVMSGWDLKQALDVDPKLTDIPMVAVSASSNFDTTSSVFDDYLSKPVKMEALFNMVEVHCRKHGHC